MEKPKLKLSVLLSRSGYLQVKSASVGTMHLNSPKQLKKAGQLSTEALAAAKKRLKEKAAQAIASEAKALAIEAEASAQ